MGFKTIYPPITSWHDSPEHDSVEHQTVVETNSVSDTLTFTQMVDGKETGFIKLNQDQAVDLRTILNDIIAHLPHTPLTPMESLTKYHAVMMSARKEYRDATVAEIRSRTAKYLAKNGLSLGSGSCFYHSHFTAEVLHEQGRAVTIQAGSCNWPRLSPEQDDGAPTTMTHFSYEWSPSDAASVEAMLKGALPEMHVWCALTDSSEIIDVTTNELVAAAALRGFDWPGPKPPDYLWSTMIEFPERTRYNPVMPAIMLIVKAYLSRFNRPAYLTEFLERRGRYAT
jgi:hypothetical protein